MTKLKQLAISRIDSRNRLYVPKEVKKIMPEGNSLSWELDEETGNVIVFVGQYNFKKAKHRKARISQ